MSGPPLRVGILGLGTVAQGLIRILRANAEEIGRRAGRSIAVTHVAARDLSRKRNCNLDGITVVSDPMFIVRQAEVDVVVELIGGQSPARELILEAIARGRHVITANKALIAEDGNALFAAARERGVMIAFEAAVAGGIPIIKAIREGLAGNRIDELAGVINGTCNYILTQMRERGLDFITALAEAQKFGYAESDPSFDVEGIDAAHKLSILAAIVFGMPLSFARVATEGITRVTPQDIALAGELGYRVKHLGIAKRAEGGIELRVHPTLVPEKQLLAKVDGVLNAILVRANAVGQVGFYGRGAGGEATASAVLADLIDVARLGGVEASHYVPPLGFQPDAVREQPIIPLREVCSAYYLRLLVADTPGVLKAITSILAEFDISIEAILQKEPREDEDATIAIITSEVPEHRLDDALAKIGALPFVREGLSRFRVEHFDE